MYACNGGGNGDIIFGDVWEWNGEKWSKVFEVPQNK